MKRRILPMFMAIIMIMSIIQVPAWAATGDDPAGEDGNPGQVSEQPVEESAEPSVPEEEPAPEEQAENYVAEVNGQGFPTLQAAIDEAEDNVETTVKLIDNIVMSTSDIVTIPEGKLIVLDMDGKSITVDSSFEGRPIVNNGSLTVVGNGTIDASASKTGGYGAIENFGTLTIANGNFRGSLDAKATNIWNRAGGIAYFEGGTYDTNGTQIRTEEGSKTTITGGTYFSPWYPAIENGGDMSISGGEFTNNSCSSCGANWGYTIRSGLDAPNAYLRFEAGTATGVQGGLAIVNGTADIYGGTFQTVACEKHSDGASAHYALYVAGESGKVECNVYGGSFTSITKVAVYVGNSNDGGEKLPAILNIYGGTFTGGPDSEGAVHVDKQLGGLEIAGGTFSSDVSKYLDPSCNMEQSEGSWVVTPLTKEDATASVGDKYYNSLSAAIAAAGDCDTVTLLKDTNEDIIIPEEAELTLDLNGRVLGNSISDTITNRGNLTITGNGTVKVSTGAKGALVNMVGGTITIQNATITRDGSGSWYVIKNHGTITIEDGAIVNMPDHASSLIDNGWYGDPDNDRDTYSGANAVLIINGGTFSGGMNTVKNDDYGELVINDGSFSNTDGAVILNWNEATINNGTFTGATGYGVLANGYLNDSVDKGQFVINGGTFTASDSGNGALFSYPLGTGNNGVISVRNGTFTGTINYNYALEISGGSFSQVIDQKYCADGFSPVSVSDSNGKYTVEVANDMTVKIMDANGNDVAAYETLDEALNKVTSGQAIVLLEDISYDKKLSIPAGVTLDGNGKSITATSEITSGAFIEVTTGNVTIKDLVVNTDGKAKHGIQFYRTTGGRLSGVTVNGGSFTSVIVNGSKNIIIENCTLNPDSSAYANIEYAMGSGVTDIPSVRVSNVNYDNSKPLVYVDNDTIKRMENVGADETLTDAQIANALKQVNQNVTISGMEMVLVDGSFVAKPIPTPVDPDDDHGSSSSSSSSSVRRYNIEADAGRGGDISPDGRVRVRRGENQTFRITADDGWEIYDVEVDGKSVGAVSRYTFENVREDHTISATFRQTGAEPETPFLPFTDVAEGAWYYDAVAYCWENGIMDGTSGTTFAPNMLLNRAMAAQVLYNLAGGTVSTAAGFPDVAAGAWYADAVNWAAAQGYVTGYDNGSFGPEDNLTREQLAVILYRYAGSPEPTGSLNGFVDAASASDYAVDALRWAVGEGLLTGKDGGRLDPTGTASRAELAQILARFAQM